MAKKNNSFGKAMGVGVGVAALTAAAYVLFGPEGKENRKKIRGWAVRMKGEIIEKLEEAKELSEPITDQIVSEIAKKYREEKSLNEKDIEDVVKELRARWKAMVRDAQGKGSTARKSTSSAKSKSGAKKKGGKK